MLKKTTIICLIMFCMFLLIPTSWAFDFVPGQYEITSKVEMPGMPSSIPPQTTTQCLTEENFVPTKSITSQDCKIFDLETKGNTVSWKMECSQQGQKMKSTAQITYNVTSFEGTIKTESGPQGGNMIIKTVISGKRVGDCQ